MGWTIYDRSMTREEALAELRRLHDWTDGDGTRYKVLEDAIVGEGYYAAVQVEEPSKPVRTFCAVCLITLRPFGYKGMADSWGPNIDRAPRAVLEKLSPLRPDDKYAAEWRARAWAHHGGEPQGRQVELAL